MASFRECDDLETIKAVIRALLVADKGPLTLHEFLCVFKRSEGQELPFKQYGFFEPLSFLRSLSDTVHLTQVGNSAEFYVRPTVTADVQHIQKLVSGQKTSKPLGSRQTTTSKHLNSLKNVQHVEDLVNGQKKSKPLMSQQAMAPKGECGELETIKAVIRALLVAEKRQLILREFLCEFKRSEGRELPFKQYGFADPLSFLRSLPDTVHLKQVGNSIEFYVTPTLTRDVEHIQNLVNGQKTSKPLGSCPPTTSKHVNSLKKVRHVHNLATGQKTSKPLMSQQGTAPKGECDELETIKAVIRALLIAEKRQLTLREFLCEFKRSEGRELPFKQYGFADPLGFLQSLPDTVHLTHVGDSIEFYIRPALTMDVRHIQNLVKGQKASKLPGSCPPTASKHKNSLKEVQNIQNLANGQKKFKPLTSHPPTISTAINCVSQSRPVHAPLGPQQLPNSQPPVVLEKIRDNLRQLMYEHFWTGINVLQLDEVYARKFGSSINYAAFGYKTIVDFLISMRAILCVTRNSAGIIVFASTRDCRQPPPPPQGRLAHLPQYSTPVQRRLPCFRVHRAPPMRSSSTVSSQGIRHDTQDIPLDTTARE